MLKYTLNVFDFQDKAILEIHSLCYGYRKI